MKRENLIPDIMSAETFFRKINALKISVENDIISPEAAEQQKEELYKKVLKKYRDKYYWIDNKGLWAVKIPDKSKKTRRKMITCKTKEGLDEKLIAYFYSDNAEPDYKVKKLFYRFLELAKKERSGGTAHRYKVDWNRYLEKSELAELDIRYISTGKLREILIDISKQHQVNKRQYGDLKTLVNKIFDYAVSYDIIDRNPSVLIRDLSRNRNVVRPNTKRDDELETFSNDEIGILIDTCVERFNSLKNTAYLGIILNLELGLRVGEIVALKFSDFNYDTMTLKLSRSEKEAFDVNGKKIGYLATDTLKGGYSEAKVIITEEVIKLLEVIKNFNKLHYGESEWVFINKDAERMHANSMENALRRVCDNAELPRRSFHKIRKTYASVLNEKMFSLPEIQKLLRHKDAMTTARYYIRNRDDDSELTRRVGSTFSYPNMNTAIINLTATN